MSYILNALKKSELERAGDPARRNGPKMPGAPQDAAPLPPYRRIGILTTAGGGAVALAAVAVWAAGPWSGASINAIDGAPELTMAAATAAPSPRAGQSSPSTVESSRPTIDEAAARPNSAPVTRVAAVEAASTSEPNVGDRMAAQRSPRPVPDEPENSTPLVAMLLEPPVSVLKPGAAKEEELPTDSSVTVVNLIPAPPGVSRAESTTTGALDKEATTPQSTLPVARSTDPLARSDVDPLPAIEVAAVAPPADPMLLRAAADHHERGWALERSGDFAAALDAFSRALEMRPDFADAYFGRAWIRDRLDQLQQATSDYGKAIRIDPNFAAAYGSRGVAQFYLDKLPEAERDFEQTLKLGRGELRRFALLWRYLSTEHDGRDGAAQLAADTKNINLDRWPGVIARYYLGAADADSILENTADPDPQVTLERLCVAYFFIAQKHLLDGSALQARDNFRKALDTGATDFVQYKAAQRELDRLARLR